MLVTVQLISTLSVQVAPGSMNPLHLVMFIFPLPNRTITGPIVSGIQFTVIDTVAGIEIQL